MKEQLPEVPGYRIKSVLGSGSAGTVYLAVQRALDREVALKVLTGWVSEGSGRQRFRLEAQVLAGLSHPNLLRLYEYQDDTELPWISVEYLPGGSLRDRIRTPSGGGIAMPVPDAVRLARNLLSALEALHAAHLIHRDVKPANILYRANGEAVLADMGLVRQADSERTRLTRPIDLLGTAAYLAPEVQTGAELSAATDLYAAGVTLYEALTGRHPSNYTPIGPSTPVTRPIELRAELPPDLAELVTSMLDPDPIGRPASARDALARLGSKRQTSRKIPKAPSKPAPNPFPAEKPPPRGRGLAAVAGFVMVVLLGLFAGVALRTAARVPLTVEAHGTGARARVPVAAADLFLSVFDDQGRVQACVNGEPQGGGTRFAVEALRPGTNYHAQVFSRSTGGLTAADTPFRTPIQIRLLGVEDGPPPGLWLTVSPPADVRWAGASSAVRVGPDGKRLPLPAQADAKAARMLQLAFESGETVTVKVSGATATPVDGARLPLGVALPDLSGRVMRWDGATASDASNAESRSMLDWLVESRVSWAVVNGKKGAPNLAAEQSEELWKRGHIGTMHVIVPAGPPAQAEWIDRLGPLEEGRLQVAVNPVWLPDQLDEEKYAQTIRTLASWREFFLARPPGVPLQVPMPGSLLVNLGLSTAQVQAWQQAMPELTGIEAWGGDAPAWDLIWRTSMAPQLKAAGFHLDVRWVWYRASHDEKFGFDMPIERYSLARAFALTRARHPQSVGIADISELCTGAQNQMRRMRPACADLLWIGQRMAGLEFEREVGDAHSSPPRLLSGNGVTGLVFAGGRRRVQLLFPERPTTVRFEPSRPGVLRDQGGSVSRPLLTTAPVDVALSDSSASFEELAPVQGEAQSASPVELEH